MKTPNVACGVTLMLQGAGYLTPLMPRRCTIRSILELFVLVSVPLDIGHSNFVCLGSRVLGVLDTPYPQEAPAMEHFGIVCSSFLSFGLKAIKFCILELL